MLFRKYNMAFVFLLFVVSCLLIVAEVLARRIPNVYGHKSHELMTNNRHYKTLILGSSHTFIGINPKYLSDSSLNAANDSQDINYDRYILESNLNALNDLEVVIMPLSVFSLYSNLESGIESWRKYNYRHWFGYTGYPLKELFDIRTHSIIFYYPKKSKLVRDFYRYFAGEFQPSWSNTGWSTAYIKSATEQTLIKSGIEAAKRHQTATKIDEKSLNSLKEIVEICEKNNLRLLIVTLPAYETYRAKLEGERLDAIAKVANEYADSNDNIKYINYLSDDRFIKKDYHDADHLSGKGTQKFTRILNQEIEEWKKPIAVRAETKL
jgi:hypothetical protein